MLLLIGFGAALVIYLTAGPVTADPLLGDPLGNKKYIRELQVIGGKANVVAAEMQIWFEGLWHGQALAGTVAVLTVGVALAFRFVATHPDYLAADPGDEETPPPGSARK